MSVSNDCLMIQIKLNYTMKQTLLTYAFDAIFIYTNCIAFLRYNLSLFCFHILISLSNDIAEINLVLLFALKHK